MPLHDHHLTSTSMAGNGAPRLLRLPTATTSLPLLQLVLLQLLCVASALNQDGVLLLSFKLSLAADPLGSLAGWGYADATPCSWNGVVCSPDSRVVTVVLPDAQLVGPVARELGLIEHLRHLDLSSNALSGTIPPELLRAPELRVLSLAGNGITGGLPEQVGQLRSLRALNLAGNALSGAIPQNLTLLPNLTAVSLANNFFSGGLPGGGFPALQVLDVSANLLNGTLPPDFGGAALRYVNLSFNRIAGAIPTEMASSLPANVTIDLSYNNLTGAIPAVPPFSVQRSTAFARNTELCGRPLDRLCSFTSSSVVEPQNGTAKSPPAIAAIPKDPTEALPGSDTNTGAGAPASRGQGRMRLATIVAIAAGDVAGIAVLFVVVLYVYQVRKRRQRQEVAKQRMGVVFKKPESDESPDAVCPSLSCCLRKKAGEDSEDTEEVTDTSASFSAKEGITDKNSKAVEAAAKKKGGDAGVLVTVDGGAELELETLLKASAYILGAAGGSIVYKAVLADGAALAVRRIGSDDASVRRFNELEAQMRAVAKLRHGNILRLRGFYWGPDEMLIIHDFAVNGSLANLSIKRKPGSSPINLGWSARLRIARGVARGLAYLHDKKCVHGNVKPSNILLDADMEPLLADLGVDRLVRGADGGLKLSALARRFGSKRSAKSLPDLSPPPGPGGPSASPHAGAPADTAAHYRAPEAVKSPKPNAKWDVYSLGVLLLELVAGRALTSLELCHLTAGADEEKAQALRLVDPALRCEMEGRDEAVACCLRLGAACGAMAPNKRPSIRDALQAIDRIPALASTAASSTAAGAAH
ncbi:probable LRR receptor-like serine/threonine-protein kinase At4g37250 [Phragmites australis]|uniref:probable LRR receptor-like serine/threonine-protein kinase At4g37250 n=1 Tax=Phragmites australis TaxID=29695 RepID=UPI002D79C296|nr:probable LRR receptor-like serine/threonine-protein kinase At4g37250 [Phragmites australis]